MADSKLPETVTQLELDGRPVYLVGTAHLSEQSVRDVHNTIDQVEPDTIAIELCQARYTSLTDPQAWRRMDVFKILRQGKAVLLLVQLALSAVYRRLGEQLNLQPGAEMLAAIDLARQRSAKLVLIDRDIQITFRRIWGNLGTWQKIRLLFHMTASCLDNKELAPATIEQLKARDAIEAIMAEFSSRFPDLKACLIDERDMYMAEKIRRSDGKRIVAVVGAGHVQGITRNLRTTNPIEPLEQVPPRSRLAAAIGWALPLLLIGLLVYGFVRTGSRAWSNVYIWVLATGSLSALGAASALAHPLAILTAFVIAPFTTLHPLLAAGWFAGLVQAWLRRPKVADLEDLPNSIASIKGFWTNPVTKVLLTTALTNLGGTIGLAVALGWISARTMS